MPRDRDDDDDDDRDDRPRDRARFPVALALAGVAWVGFGLLAVVGTTLRLALGQGADNTNVLAVTVAILAIGLAFIGAGISAIRGRLKGVRGPAVASLVFALFYCGIGGLGLSQAGKGPAAAQGSAMLVSAVFGLLGTMLLGASVLALASGSAYRRWRVAEGLEKPAARPARRRRDEEDDEDEEEDDRPRRKARRRDDEDEDEDEDDDEDDRRRRRKK